MDGLIVVNKPQGWTSRDVVNKLNKIFKQKRIGHTGTLDPIATGVLVCSLGKYTKLVNEVTAYDKEYIAGIKLGVMTDTMDITGKIIKQQDFSLTKEEVITCFNNFPKEYMQTVPIYSAVKIKGKKLYEYARDNIEVDLPKRNVHIYSLELISLEKDILKFKACVSKGTYIRSLIQDITEKLNVIGTMASLVRTKQGSFSLDNAYTIEDIMANNFKVLEVQDFLDYPRLELTQEELSRVQNGACLINKSNYQDKVLCLYNKKAIAIYIAIDNYLKSYIQL